MKYHTDKLDYILIGLGILLLPVFGLGLILIGIAIYRIGHKMEKYQQENNEFPITRQTRINQYDNDILEEMR